MPMRCSWGLCNLDSRYPERCIGVKFIPFIKPCKIKPWNYEKCLRWIQACGRPHEQLNINKISKNHYICSKHFVDGEPSRENPDPIPAITTSAKSSSSRKKKLRLKRLEPLTPEIQKIEAAKLILTSQQTSTSGLTDEALLNTRKDSAKEHVTMEITEVIMADDSRHSSSPATPGASNPGTPRSEIEVRATPPLARATPPLSGPLIHPSMAALKNSTPMLAQAGMAASQQAPSHHQSKYASLLAVIEDMGRDIRPTYSGNRTSTERLKRSIVHARILVRECLMECERSART